MWCVPEINEEYVERMEDVLETYGRPHDATEPVVCIDERPVVLHEDARPGQPMLPGLPARTDYEYVRRGTANVFCIVEPKTGRRLTHATDRRTGKRFAQALRRIHRRYRRAKTIHLVMDNLSTHGLKSCVAAYGEMDGRRLWKRFTVHYTPKHASWLNAAEIEASLVSSECLGRRRIQDLSKLKAEVRSWSAEAERARRTINWKFRVSDARALFRYAAIKTARSRH